MRKLLTFLLLAASLALSACGAADLAYYTVRCANNHSLGCQ